MEHHFIRQNFACIRLKILNLIHPICFKTCLLFNKLLTSIHQDFHIVYFIVNRILVILFFSSINHSLRRQSRKKCLLYLNHIYFLVLDIIITTFDKITASEYRRLIFSYLLLLVRDRGAVVGRIVIVQTVSDSFFVISLG